MLFTPRVIAAAAALALLFALSGLLPPLGWVALLGNLGLLFGVLLDLLITRPGEGLTVTRRLGDGMERGDGPTRLTVGADNRVTVVVSSQRAAPSRVSVKDDPPHAMRWDRREARMEVPPRGSAELTYSVRPDRRGEYHFGDIALREPGRLGLVTRQWSVPAARTVSVYPNVSETRRYEALVLRGRLHELGARRSLLKGGREFASLREYGPDDPVRDIDWKATARRVKPIVRQYDIERSQQVMILIDAGRLMGTRAGDLTKLDHAINSALVLAYVGLGIGDRVGCLSFASEVRGFVPPGKGPEQLSRLLETLHALQPETANPSFLTAHLRLQASVRRRALVVLFTDLADPETARSALRHLGLLAHKHLCLCAALGDPEVARLARSEPAAESDVYRQAVALSVLEQRRLALARLRSLGVEVVDALPGELTGAVVARYLRLKDSGAL